MRKFVANLEHELTRSHLTVLAYLKLLRVQGRETVSGKWELTSVIYRVFIQSSFHQATNVSALPPLPHLMNWKASFRGPLPERVVCVKLMPRAVAYRVLAIVLSSGYLTLAFGRSLLLMRCLSSCLYIFLSG